MISKKKNSVPPQSILLWDFYLSKSLKIRAWFEDPLLGKVILGQVSIEITSSNVPIFSQGPLSSFVPNVDSSRPNTYGPSTNLQLWQKFVFQKGKNINLKMSLCHDVPRCTIGVRVKKDEVSSLLSGARFHQRSTYSFYAVAPQIARTQSSCQYLFTLLWPTSVKVVRRTLMKLTPGLNLLPKA